LGGGFCAKTARKLPDFVIFLRKIAFFGKKINFNQLDRGFGLKKY